MGKSATQLLDEIQAGVDALRVVLIGDPAKWSPMRQSFAFLRAFDGREDGLDFAEREKAAKAFGYDMRGTGGFFNSSGASLRWVSEGRAGLTDAGKTWLAVIASQHPDWA
jgi:hypothetical protein